MVSIFTPGIDACAADAAECEINVAQTGNHRVYHPQETSSNIPPGTVSDTRPYCPSLCFLCAFFLLQKTSSGNP